MTDENEAKTIGYGDVLRGVNLRDFFDMVKGELGLVWAAARNAVRSRPILLPFAVLLVLLRLALLVAVVVVLGGAITLVMLVRGASRSLGGRQKPGSGEGTDGP